MAAAADRIEIDELDREFGATAEAVLAARLPLRPEAPVEELAARWRELQPELTELGWFDLLRDEEAGGLGLGPDVLAGTFAAVGRNLAPGPILTGVLTIPWLSGRTDLSALPQGPVAFADTFRAGWAAKPTPMLRDHVLEGAIGGVPNLPECTTLLVVAQTADGSPCVVWLGTDAKGLTVTPQTGLDPAWTFGEARFDATPVDKAALLLEGDEAQEWLTTARAWERILISCEISGIVERLWETSVDYAKDRKQFGRPIGSFQAIKHLLADLTTMKSTLENLVRLTMREAAASDERELAESAAALKAHASRVGRAGSEIALQVHGGIGFTSEYPLHLYLKRALTLSAYLGDADELEGLLGSRAVGLEVDL